MHPSIAKRQAAGTVSRPPAAVMATAVKPGGQTALQVQKETPPTPDQPVHRYAVAPGLGTGNKESQPGGDPNSWDSSEDSFNDTFRGHGHDCHPRCSWHESAASDILGIEVNFDFCGLVLEILNRVLRYIFQVQA